MKFVAVLLLAGILYASDSKHLIVLFRTEIDSPTAERILLGTPGITKLERPDLLSNQYLIQTSLAGALALSSVNEIAYIYPASQDLVDGVPVHGCLGFIGGDDEPIGQYIATYGHGWADTPRGEATLTYSFSRPGGQVPRQELIGIVERALAEWSRHAQIRFIRGGSGGLRNIDFVFASGNHGDPYPFDGRGRVLGHTFYPSDVMPEPLAGDIHLDDEEPWSTKTDPDLYSVVLHEIGHSLGLKHSDRPGAVMYPYYRRLNELQGDDIAALQRLYAAASAPVTPPVIQPIETTPPPSVPSTPAPPTPGPSTDRTAPSLTITFPATTLYATSAASVRLAGTARDSSAIAEVTWSSSTGLSGVAAGTNNWRIDSLPLLVGDNTVIIYARDAAGNTGRRTLTFTRR